MGLMPEQAIKMMQPAMDKCKSFSAFADKIGKVNWAELYGDLPEHWSRMPFGETMHSVS
jgi:hypothetical protein